MKRQSNVGTYFDFLFFCNFPPLLIPADIEAQILEIQGMKATLLEEGDQGVGLDSTGFFDQEIYGGSDSRFTGYVTSIAANEQEDVSILLHGGSDNTLRVQRCHRI